MTKLRLRSDDKPDDDEPTKGKCGRAKDAACGMSEPSECSVHGKTKEADPDETDPNDEKALRRLLRFLRVKDAADGDPDDVPLAHEDSIRMAHKCLRTSKAFLTEGLIHHNKAVDLLGDVVDAIDDAPADDDDKRPVDDAEDEPSDDDDAATAKAKQKRRAAKLMAKYKI